MRRIENAILIVLVLLFTIVGSVVSGELKPFSTDGCSKFPDGIAGYEDLWKYCCIEHDLAYWKGGTYQQRLQADRRLKQCVASVGHPLIGKIMLAGVRVGGSPYLDTPFRWGYGWPFGRGYKALSPDEIKQVQRLQPEFPWHKKFEKTR
jgi:hypothetical protein